MVMALLVGCSEVAPEVPARDGGNALDGSEVSAAIDADTSDASAVIDATSDVADALAPTEGGGDAATTDVAAPSAEFLAVYEGILRPRCATSGCHVVGSSVTRLAMSDASSAYANLVNRRDECSTRPGTRIRVVPFDPAMSAVMLFNMDGLCGLRHNIIVPSSYGGAERDADAASLRAWILAGAR